nr:ABC transporter ATP-binding protein [Dactylosporangium thailandense]
MISTGEDREVLVVERLKTEFVSGGRVAHAVRGVSLRARRGRTLVLLGESGSGKSVTLRSLHALAGRTARYRGSVSILGQSVLDASPDELRRTRGAVVALVPQDPAGALDPLSRVGRQIEEVLLTHDAVANRGAARRRSLELLVQVGISEPERVARSFPHELSGGMRQRVAIAIAVSCGPALLLADEPTTALDVTTQAQILRLFGDLRQRLGMAMLFVTHDVGVAREIGDDVAVMYAGLIIEQGTAQEVLDSPRHPYTRALLAAMPTPDIPKGGLAAIGGAPPPLDLPITGCPFAPRCPIAQESCLDAEPPLTVVSGSHATACPVLAQSPRLRRAVA